MATTHQDGASQPAQLLLVEDDFIVALDAEDVLTRQGHRVLATAHSAAEALRHARSHRLDLVVMDIRLIGERDGIDAAIDLYEAHRLRCVFATAYDDAAFRRRAEAARPLGWVRKPYSAAELVDAVNRAIAVIRSGAR